MNFGELQKELRQFADERDWGQFHSPKNLAMALSVEAAELLEHFQWMTQEESAMLQPGASEGIASEIADVQIYLAMLAGRLNIDIDDAVKKKIKINAKKYPVGNSMPKKQ